MHYFNSQEAEEYFNKCYFLYKQYKWLLDSYIVDFFVENYWEKLLPAWKLFFENIDPRLLAELLNYKTNSYKKVMPLSLLATKQILQDITLPRYPTIDSTSKEFDELKRIFFHRAVNNLFWKNVKKKKVYEISVLSEKVVDIVKNTQVDLIVDCGSGLGHLARLLAYKYKLKLVCLEAQESLTKRATELDQELERRAAKYDNFLLKDCERPRHINFMLKRDLSIDELLRTVASKNNSARIGLIGLHPCGDLASVLLHLFKESNQVSFVFTIGCCYSKVTKIGYPLSDSLKNKRLSYAARELACHALEQLVQQLHVEGLVNLRTHAWRAALEDLMIKHRPDLKHAGLRSVKYSKDITFQDYCCKALEGSDLKLSNEDMTSIHVKEMLNQVDNVVVFNILRTFFAPLLETIILLDRLLYLNSNEQNVTAVLEPIFNPLISSRNHLLIAYKR